jgi:hypothetical protein
MRRFSTLTKEQKVQRGLEMAERLALNFDRPVRFVKTRFRHRLILWAFRKQVYRDGNGTGMVFRRMGNQIHMVEYIVWRKAR